MDPPSFGSTGASSNQWKPQARQALSEDAREARRIDAGGPTAPEICTWPRWPPWRSAAGPRWRGTSGSSPRGPRRSRCSLAPSRARGGAWPRRWRSGGRGRGGRAPSRSRPRGGRRPSLTPRAGPPAPRHQSRCQHGRHRPGLPSRRRPAGRATPGPRQRPEPWPSSWHSSYEPQR